MNANDSSDEIVDTSEQEHRSSFPVDSIATGVAFLLFLTIAQRGIGLLRSIMFCRWMTDEQLGTWSLTFSFLLLAAPLAVLGLPGCFGRYVQRFDRQQQLLAFLRRIGIVAGVSSLVLVGTLIVFKDSLTWVLFRSTSSSLAVAAGVVLLVVIVSNALTELMSGLRQVRIAAVMRFVSSVVFAIGSLILMGAGIAGGMAALFGFGLGAVAAIAVASFHLFRHRSGWSSSSEQIGTGRFWTTLIPYAFWLWVMDLLSNLIEISDRYMLLHLVRAGSDEARAMVGQYHSSLVLPLILVGLAGMIGGAILPYLSHEWEVGEKRRVQQGVMAATKFVLLGFSVIAALGCVCSPILFDVILQGRYDVGSDVLPWTFVMCIWLGTTYIVLDYLWCAELGRLANIGMAVALAMNLLLNFLLIPTLGLNGAVMGTSVANLGLLVCTLLVCRWAGCPVPLSMYPLLLLPALLLLQPLLPILAVALMLLVPAIRQTFFDQTESEMFVASVKKLAQKFGLRLKPKSSHSPLA